MDRRNELAAAAAAAFAEEHNAGGSGEEQAGPGPEGFTEGAAEGESVQGEALPPALAPALCWQPAQLAAATPDQTDHDDDPSPGAGAAPEPSDHHFGPHPGPPDIRKMREEAAARASASFLSNVA
jgi:hypothetical protein